MGSPFLYAHLTDDIQDQINVTALSDIRQGGKRTLAKALATIESRPETPETIALLDEAYNAPVAQVVGITGPPGVGKSTLINAMIAEWRSRDLTVAVIAVDPSSRRTGGALLGDRTRLATDPLDKGIFVRSMAARDRLGGLAPLTTASMILMRALFDIVLVETVGVGQSETDVVSVADTVLFCIQPGSGDSLQFMKAGIMEIPHIMVVTKGDMGKPALRARADVKGAISLNETPEGGWDVPVLLISSMHKDGMDKLADSIDSHFQYLKVHNQLAEARTLQAQAWLEEMVRDRFGREGLKKAGALSLHPGESPFKKAAAIAERLL